MLQMRGSEGHRRFATLQGLALKTTSQSQTLSIKHTPNQFTKAQRGNNLPPATNELVMSDHKKSVMHIIINW